MNNEIENINKRLGVAEYLHSTINNEIEFLQEQINLLNERLELKRGHLADAQYEVTRIVKEKQTAERFAQA
jgi:predicted  nucleic acid-binding Zn-ribbon protein